VAKPDANNAHIRKGSKRQSPDIIANDAERLLKDPAFIRGFDGVRNGTIALIETTAHDGSPEFDAAEREMCRTLRTLASIRKDISLCVQNQTLRLADFKPLDVEDEAKPKKDPPDFSRRKTTEAV